MNPAPSLHPLILLPQARPSLVSGTATSFWLAAASAQQITMLQSRRARRAWPGRKPAAARGRRPSMGSACPLPPPPPPLPLSKRRSRSRVGESPLGSGLVRPPLRPARARPPPLRSAPPRFSPLLRSLVRRAWPRRTLLVLTRPAPPRPAPRLLRGIRPRSLARPAGAAPAPCLASCLAQPSPAWAVLSRPPSPAPLCIARPAMPGQQPRPAPPCPRSPAPPAPALAEPCSSATPDYPPCPAAPLPFSHAPPHLTPLPAPSPLLPPLLNSGTTVVKRQSWVFQNMIDDQSEINVNKNT